MPLLVCPNCTTGMTQVNRSGIELDMCPQCRGVWLDRGELEKMLEPLRNEQRQQLARGDRFRDDDDDDDRYRGERYGGRRRNSILDIFD